MKKMSEKRDRPTPAPRKSQAPGLPQKTQKYFNIIHISPSSVIYNKNESVVLVFSQSLPNNVDFTIRFTGLSTQRECEASAVKIGDNVLRFRAPEYYPPEETELTVHHGNHLTMLCRHKPFTFVSYLEQIKNTLMNVGDPIEFMCAAFHLKTKNVVALDFELEKQFKKNLPSNFNLLAKGTRERIRQVQEMTSNPTLLHFAARYNLVKLSVTILECPGGFDALNIANEDGLVPSQIAIECGNDRLGSVLADAQQRPNMLEEAEDIYLSMQDHSLYETYVTVMSNADSGELYERMDYAAESIYDEIYENTTSLQQSGDIDPELFSPRTKDTHQTGRDRGSQAPDTRSIASLSSTSSGESTASSGSGYESVFNRPAMPMPRGTRSYNEYELKEHDVKKQFVLDICLLKRQRQCAGKSGIQIEYAGTFKK
ncbi:phosphoinositide 3-kinase adapter protein 1-like isoform X3 [Rhopilema esculentum]|uniref:phosphoinositide 3-kinase adapter protein 1-like isoform X3 n=1 Tax=Rhopilema esculentum TaxID=499914 RepID=UPI0031CDF669